MAALAVLGLGAHGLGLALPANEVITRYYSDETMKKRVGTATLRCSGRITRTGRQTDFEKQVTGQRCSTGTVPKDPTVPCEISTDPKCTKLPGKPPGKGTAKVP